MRGAVSMALAYNQVKDQIISFSMDCYIGQLHNLKWVMSFT